MEHPIQELMQNISQKNKEEIICKKNYFVFLDGKDYFAVPLEAILEIVEIKNTNELITIPLLDDYILGVLNIRGEMIPVLSTLKMLGFTQEDVFFQYAVVIEVAFKTAIAAREIYEIISLDEKKIRSKALGENSSNIFLLEEFDYNNNIVRIIDMPRLFSSIFLK
ncbi:MAG: hypothetical protein A2Y41_12270 [Spirochaetes bacterium GWB1_36_13]|nr:MAG: hypothetical protein A2Y41_12270 [Spirochaetes bacterium GWB1_36_13]